MVRTTIRPAKPRLGHRPVNVPFKAASPTWAPSQSRPSLPCGRTQGRLPATVGALRDEGQTNRRTAFGGCRGASRSEKTAEPSLGRLQMPASGRAFRAKP